MGFRRRVGIWKGVRGLGRWLSISERDQGSRGSGGLVGVGSSGGGLGLWEGYWET